MTNKPAISCTTPRTGLDSSANRPLASRMFINRPITTMLHTVPRPSGSPNSMTAMPMTKPTKMVTVPIWTPITLAMPAWNTSHGA